MNEFRRYDARDRELSVPDDGLTRLVNATQLSGLLYPVLCPAIETGSQFGYWPILDMPPRYEDLRRAPGAAPRQIGVSVSTIGYFNQGYALTIATPLEDAANVDQFKRYEASLALAGGNIMKIGGEVQVGSLLAASTTISTPTVIGSSWSGTGRAFQNVEAAVNLLEDGGSFRSSLVLAFGKTAYRAYTSNSSTIAAYQGWITPERIAERHRVRQVVVAEAPRDSAGEGFTYAPEAIFDDIIIVTTQPANQEDIFAQRHAARSYWRPKGSGASIPGQYLVEKLDIDSKEKSRGIMISEYSGLVVLDPRLAVTIRGCNSSQSGGWV